MAKWVVSGKKCDFKGIGDHLGIDQVVVRIMRNRDLTDEEEMKRFLSPDRSCVHDYNYLKDIDKAVDITLDKIDESAKIRIIGDYDVDGIMSTYILWKGLTICGADVDTVIPHRIKDGYGINESMIDDAANDGVDLLITCDNGIAAADAFDHALELGLTCIVTDHHEIPYEETDGERRYILPNVPAVVDPKREDCIYPFKNICGAVVAFKFIQALFDAIGMETEPLEELMELAGFATVCDIMELKDENRYLVRNTLKCLKKSHNLGMRALVKACGLEGKSITSQSIGFVLGPCINATGRLDTADISLDLLKCETIEDGIRIASGLKELNESRKYMTEEGLKSAEELVDAKDKVIVVHLPRLHESLAGIVAGRIKEKYYRPVFVVTGEGDALKGSARSIPGFHIYDAMCKVKDVFTKFGGHAMAAGFSLNRDRLEEFKRRINECEIDPDSLEEKIVIDVPMPLSYVSEKLIDQLSMLEPFGNGNEKPVFAYRNIRFLEGRYMGKNANMAKFSVTCEDGFDTELVMFRKLDLFLAHIDEKFGEGTSKRLMTPGARENVMCDIIYYPAVNEYMGKRSVQFIINDYR